MREAQFIDDHRIGQIVLQRVEPGFGRSHEGQVLARNGLVGLPPADGPPLLVGDDVAYESGAARVAGHAQPLPLQLIDCLDLRLGVDMPAELVIGGRQDDVVAAAPGLADRQPDTAAGADVVSLAADELLRRGHAVPFALSRRAFGDVELERRDRTFRRALPLWR